MQGKAKGLPKVSNSGIINGSKPQTKGGKPSVKAGTNYNSGRAATKVTKVR